jgi:hypothetical protein
MVKLYVEGGGDYAELHSACREGFRKFLEKAGIDRMPRIVSCGGRQAAYDHFKTSCKLGETSLLLIDSEDCVITESPWSHLLNRAGDGFTKPENATDDHCHLMVVCMESWFLADKDALRRFFGQDFKENNLSKNTNTESVSKEDIFKGMQKATNDCKTKAPYGKGEHSFKILREIDPKKVKGASPWAKRFLNTLDTFMKQYK